VAGGIACLLLVMKMVMGAVRNKLQKLVEDRFTRDEIVAATLRANFFGEKSKGGKQVRGNGALVLTKNNLCFIRALPVKEYIIPIKAVDCA
jgi:hypothetical protein